MNERLSQALISSANGLSSLDALTSQGRFIEGLDSKKVEEYSQGVTSYLDLVKGVLHDEGVASLVGNNVRIAKVFFDNNKVKIFLPEEREESVLIRVESYERGKDAKEKLQSFLNDRFPGPTWSFGVFSLEHFAERELMPLDLIPREKPGFDRNSLLEAFVVGLDQRVRWARQQTALNETGEISNKGLQERIDAFAKANQILAQVINPAKK